MEAPLLGFSKDRPSTGTTPHVHSQMAKTILRPGEATLQVRSALAVPPGFDGLLRAILRRFVAPCSQSWGSPRFSRIRCTDDGPCGLTYRTANDLPNSAVHTLQSFSLAVSRTVSPRPLPPHRSHRRRDTSRTAETIRTAVQPRCSASRPCSADESVVLTRRFRRIRPDALLGFVPLQGPPPRYSAPGCACCEQPVTSGPSHPEG